MSKKPMTLIDKTDGPAKPAQNQAGTRAQILDLLKRGGAQSAAALGGALGITAMAVKLHLYELEAEGLVSAEDEAPKGGRGRPTKLWALTEGSMRIFPNAHQSLAVEMIKSVEELFGEKGLAKLIKKHGDTQRETYGAQLSTTRTIGERVKRLAQLRLGEGYMAEAQKDGRDWLLIENHCPICSAAKACTGLCANELKVFSDVLGPDVSIKREEHILAGARRCTYRVEPA